MEREALTPAEVGEVLGIGRRKLRELLESGQIKVVRLGPKTRRIPLAALREWLSEQQEEKTA
jgi:excisionase family DNA binding protein